MLRQILSISAIIFTTTADCGGGKENAEVICKPDDTSEQRSLVFDSGMIRQFGDKVAGGGNCGAAGAKATWHATKTVQALSDYTVSYVINVVGTIQGGNYYVCSASPASDNFPDIGSPSTWHCNCT